MATRCWFQAPAATRLFLRFATSFHSTSPGNPPLIALVAYAPLVAVTSAGKSYQRLADVLADAKARPKVLLYSTYGPGSQPHLAAELLADAAGVDLQAVPYKGSADALLGLMRGDVDIGVETVSAASAHIKAGKLRALAVTSAHRSAFLPQVPGMEELNLAKASIQGFYAIAAPAGTPVSVVDRLVKEVDAIMSTPESKAKCAPVVGGRVDWSRRTTSGNCRRTRSIPRVEQASQDQHGVTGKSDVRAFPRTRSESMPILHRAHVL